MDVEEYKKRIIEELDKLNDEKYLIYLYHLIIRFLYWGSILSLFFG